MTYRGWTTSNDEILQIRLLDWIYDSTRESRIPTLDGFLDAVYGQVDDDTLEGILASLGDQGLIDVTHTLGGIRASHATLTNRGVTDVRNRRERRGGHKARAIAAREALLDWFYVQKRNGRHSPVTDGILDDPRGHFEGESFTEREISDAGGYLKDKRLINAIGAMGHPALRGEIEPLGEDVVENHDGSITAWLTAQTSGGQQFVTHFNAEVSGQVGIGNTVNQTQNQGFDVATLIALVADVREFATEVDTGHQQYLLTYLDVIQAEATNPEPDEGVIRSGGDRLKQIASKAGNAGLTASVSALVQFIAKALAG